MIFFTAHLVTYTKEIFNEKVLFFTETNLDLLTDRKHLPDVDPELCP